MRAKHESLRLSGARAARSARAASAGLALWEAAALGILALAAVFVVFSSWRRFDGEAAAPARASEAQATSHEAEPGTPHGLEVVARSAAEEHAVEAEPAAPLAERSASGPRDGWKESDFLAEFRALASESELVAAVDLALGPGRPDAEAMAALRTSFERRAQRSADHFLRAARERTDAAHGRESVARAGVHWLGARAARDGAAREVLEELAFAPDVAPELRAASAHALVSAAPEAELDRLDSRFARVRDELVAVSARSALHSRRAPHDENGLDPASQAEEP